MLLSISLQPASGVHIYMYICDRITIVKFDLKHIGCIDCISLYQICHSHINIFLHAAYKFRSGEAVDIDIVV